jgi:hypothetical protein
MHLVDTNYLEVLLNKMTKYSSENHKKKRDQENLKMRNIFQIIIENII